MSATPEQLREVATALSAYRAHFTESALQRQFIDVVRQLNPDDPHRSAVVIAVQSNHTLVRRAVALSLELDALRLEIATENGGMVRRNELSKNMSGCQSCGSRQGEPHLQHCALYDYRFGRVIRKHWEAQP